MSTVLIPRTCKCFAIKKENLRLGVVVHTCDPSYMEAEIGESWSKAHPGQKLRPYLKI
jgi:hypothetical protein